MQHFCDVLVVATGRRVGTLPGPAKHTQVQPQALQAWEPPSRSEACDRSARAWSHVLRAIRST